MKRLRSVIEQSILQACRDIGDRNIPLAQIIKESFAVADSKGWHEGNFTSPDKFGELLLLTDCEIAEAFEQYRDGRAIDEIYFVKDKRGRQKPEGVPVELADALIRLGDLCARYNIPLARAYRLKTEYNKTRPYRHGGKKA